MNRLKSLLSATKNISSESVELFFSGRAWKFVVCLLSFFSSQWQISGSALLHSQFSWSGGRDPSLLKKKKKKGLFFFLSLPSRLLNQEDANPLVGRLPCWVLDTVGVTNKVFLSHPIFNV